MFKRLWKRLTIRRRAKTAGIELNAPYDCDGIPMWLFSNVGDRLKTDPVFRRHFRTLVRLNRICGGLEPFRPWVGTIDGVYVGGIYLELVGCVQPPPPTDSFGRCCDGLLELFENYSGKRIPIRLAGTPRPTTK